MIIWSLDKKEPLFLLVWDNGPKDVIVYLSLLLWINAYFLSREYAVIGGFLWSH